MSMGYGEVIGWYAGEDMHGPYCPDCYAEMGLAGGDTDTPIFAYGHEADAPSHCAVCEALIPHDLTPDGIEYVREAVREAAENPGDTWRAMITGQWRDRYLEGGAA
jgi:hypothetical protein